MTQRVFVRANPNPYSENVRLGPLHQLNTLQFKRWAWAWGSWQTPEDDTGEGPVCKHCKIHTPKYQRQSKTHVYTQIYYVFRPHMSERNNALIDFLSKSNMCQTLFNAIHRKCPINSVWHHEFTLAQRGGCCSIRYRDRNTLRHRGDGNLAREQETSQHSCSLHSVSIEKNPIVTCIFFTSKTIHMWDFENRLLVKRSLSLLRIHFFIYFFHILI